MPCLAAADELMIISSRLAEVQSLRTSNMHCSSGVSGAYLRTRLALGLDGGVFDLAGLRQHLYDATTYRFRSRKVLHDHVDRTADIVARDRPDMEIVGALHSRNAGGALTNSIKGQDACSSFQHTTTHA